MSLNLKKVKERAEEAANRSSGSGQKRDLRWYNFRGGVQSIRLLPPDFEGKTVIPDNELAFPVYTHYLPDKQKAKCVARTYPALKLSCAVCTAVYEFRDWTKTLGEDDAERLMKQYGLRGRAYTNCIDRSSINKDVISLDGKTIEIPQVMLIGLPMTVFGWINSQISAGACGDITDPKDGHDLIITKTGAGLSTEYSPGLKLDKSPISEDPAVTAALLRNMYDVASIFAFPDKEELDKQAVLADGIHRLAQGKGGSTTVNPKQGQIPGEAAALLGGDVTPDCYKNYVASLGKCRICPFNDTCEDESDPQRQKEERLAVHATSTWMTEAQAA